MVEICIDGWNLALQKGSGIATYGRTLLNALGGLGVSKQVLYGPPVPPRKPDFMNEVAVSDARRFKQKAGPRRALQTVTSRFGRSAYPIPRNGEIFWRDQQIGAGDISLWASTDIFELANRAFRTYRTFVPLTFAAENSDQRRPQAMHWTAPLPIYAKNTANIYTFHDLIPLKLPYTTLDDKNAFYDQCRQIVKRADHIITVSEATRRDVLSLLKADPDRVTTTYQSLDVPLDSLREDSDVAGDLDRIFDLEWKGYFLFFGAVEPKKNLGRLLEAYLSANVKTPLVVVAGRSWLAETDLALLHHAVEHGAGVRMVEYLPADLLQTLIQGAKATLFPSLYEGFGLPVLESMAMGTAVMTSTGGSLPEVVGDAGLQVDPRNPSEIRQAIITLDADASLRLELEHKGKAQARVFSPQAYQDRLKAAYKAAGVL
jgi:glycosyltransferase involved in cell wall biosynthesis